MMSRVFSGGTKCFFSWHHVKKDRRGAEDACAAVDATLPTFKTGEEFHALMEFLTDVGLGRETFPFSRTVICS